MNLVFQIPRTRTTPCGRLCAKDGAFINTAAELFILVTEVICMGYAGPRFVSIHFVNASFSSTNVMPSVLAPHLAEIARIAKPK